MSMSMTIAPSTGTSSATGGTAKAVLMVDPQFLAMFPNPRPAIPLLVCRYNPTTLRMTGGTSWTPAEANQQRTLPREQFQARRPRTLSVTLFFDQYPTGDLEPEMKALWDWTEGRKDVLGKSVSAPFLRFQWGMKNYFKCYIESLSVTYTLFSNAGAPLRATADVTLKETMDILPWTNPTSGGPGGERSHTVAAGETLTGIAHHYYGRARYWRGLAEFNGIDDPQRLPTGTRLAVPDAEVIEGLPA